MSLEPSTILIPVLSPPTPAPSPRPSFAPLPDPSITIRHFDALQPHQRREYLFAILKHCTPSELLFLATTVEPLLKRDFLRDLPPELALHILTFVDEPITLCRASCVNSHWNRLIADDSLWHRLCRIHRFDPHPPLPPDPSHSHLPTRHHSRRSTGSILPSTPPQNLPFSFRSYFKSEYITVSNWRSGGSLLRNHRVPFFSPPHRFPDRPNAPDPQSAIPTSIALDSDWVVVGLANSRIHVYSARTGVLSRTLVGHTAGVWAVALVKAGGAPSHPLDLLHLDNAHPPFSSAPSSPPHLANLADHQVSPTLRTALGLDIPSRRIFRRKSMSELFPNHSPGTTSPPRFASPGKPSDPAGASDGWGQPNSLVVSSGCDKELRVWDVKSGYCIYVLRGHQATVRCLKVLHNRPIAVSGSRDRTVRVWDIQRGKLLRVLEGHEQSVRCLDVCGDRVVSGSYDCTCRIWDINTGACLHVLRGHFHQIYCVAFDGVRVASGGIDTTVRVWDPETGQVSWPLRIFAFWILIARYRACLALLQGHTGLVCQLQLSPTRLVTGGSDGRIITFSIGSSYSLVQRLAAHDNSITGLQANKRFLVTGGADGRSRLFQFDDDGSGKCDYVRELSDPSENVWKVACTKDTCVVMSKRAGKTIMEIWSFKPQDG